jgi:hypothetical protein
MSKRLEVLQNSLLKKEAKLDAMIQAHFDDVRSANGQPLNDKRNGRSTMSRWDKQNDAIRVQQQSIEKTKNAIEIELGKINQCQNIESELPQEILDMIADGSLTQWRKHPNRFFVPGVDKARIIWRGKDGLAFSHLKEVANAEQHKKFAQVYNHLKKKVG